MSKTVNFICLCLCRVEPRVMDEEVPVVQSSEDVAVKVEQLDDSSHYPSYPSPAADKSTASTSGAPFSGKPTAKTSSQLDVLI